MAVLKQEQKINLTTKKQHPRLRSMKDFYRKLKRNKAALVGGYLILFLTIVSLIGPYFLSNGINDVDYTARLQPPSAEYWLGTDQHGRDIFSRIIYGGQITLIVGFLSVALGGIVGVAIGIASGYYGGKIDTVIMRLMDILLAFPGILLALAIVSILGPDIVNVIYAVAIYSIPSFARIARGSTLSVKKLEYIDAVRGIGAGDFRILVRHVLPNVISPLIVQATLSIATAILTASGLSFLGLGAQPPSPEWGAMLNDGRGYMHDAGHIALFPGLAIVIAVLAFNLFGDGIRDALDPKSK
ncbi:nickel transporter permease [Allobacillus halotolerans]|uniref:ABC transporter permease n=1 Tax=Allobacillus halotolerans TaxID=570278 RepID=A0ABS6GS77_9BACI|nr:nickel transporter permease [Allobacillus halotolerans]MBU6081981.1 ABC transporter permease [Allobacillus halotolerans]